MNYRDSDKNRFLKTIRWESVDRVPNLETLFESKHVDAILGRKRGMSSWEISPADQIELAMRTGIDFLFTGGYGKFGQNYTTMEDGSRQYVDGTIKDRVTFNGWDFVSEFHDKLERIEFNIKNLTQETRKSKVGAAVAIRSVFADATLSMGTSDFMLAMYDDPSMVTDMLDLYLDFALRVLGIVARFPVDLVLIDDDLSDSRGLMIGEARTRELWYPRTKVITDRLQALGIPYIGHCCGNLDKVIPMFVELGYLAVHPIQPSCNDIYSIRTEYGRQIALVGNIDILETLALGTEEMVRADVLNHLNRLGVDGGYVLCSSHTMVNSIPTRNYEVMLEAMREFVGDVRLRGEA